MGDGERVGADGIEQWAEDYLKGKHGGELYVINPAGDIVTKVGESAPQAADSVYLTIDQNLQYYTEQALKGFTGAAVVLERDTGRVLAMATSPSYDANIFAADNPNGSARYSELLQANQPFLNRAAMGQYPLGSVFKIITMAAGMESGLFEAQSTFDCQYDWAVLPERIRHDWTWQHCQDRQARGLECNTSDSIPSGVLNLSEGLMRSCNPYFWEMGYDLYQNSRANDIANRERVEHAEYHLATGLLPGGAAQALRTPLVRHGIRANRATLETAARYSHEQGLTKRLVGLEECFAASTMEQ